MNILKQYYDVETSFLNDGNITTNDEFAAVLQLKISSCIYEIHRNYHLTVKNSL